jgi:hypothetical protein
VGSFFPVCYEQGVKTMFDEIKPTGEEYKKTKQVMIYILLNYKIGKPKRKPKKIGRKE